MAKPILIFVLARIDLSVLNTNLHLKVGKSGLGRRKVWIIHLKVKCNKIPNLGKDQN